MDRRQVPEAVLELSDAKTPRSDASVAVPITETNATGLAAYPSVIAIEAFEASELYSVVLCITQEAEVVHCVYGNIWHPLSQEPPSMYSYLESVSRV